jgi:hypothetical protein
LSGSASDENADQSEVQLNTMLLEEGMARVRARIAKGESGE